MSWYNKRKQLAKLLMGGAACRILAFLAVLQCQVLILLFLPVHTKNWVAVAFDVQINVTATAVLFAMSVSILTLMKIHIVNRKWTQKMTSWQIYIFTGHWQKVLECQNGSLSGLTFEGVRDLGISEEGYWLFSGLWGSGRTRIAGCSKSS